MNHALQLAIRTLAAGALAATVAQGQTVLNDTKKIADARKFFDTLQHGCPGCEAFPLKPRFLFSLRLQAGFVARLPASLSPVQGRQWIVLTRITPMDGKGSPVYLSQVVQLAAEKEPRIEGSYWLGEGRYAVEFLMFDGRGDVCRKDWQIDARLNSGVSGFQPILSAGEVGGTRGTGEGNPAATRSVGRLTILLHAASVLQMQTLLGNLDKAMLLDGLVALMKELPAGSVRLVVFNLEQRRELLRKDDFTLQALPEVMQLLDAVQPAAVDFSAIQNPGGTKDFLERLLSREMRSSEPSEAVVVLGPRSMYKAKPSVQFGLPPGSKQRFYYLVCDPTRFLLPRSSTLDGGDWGVQGYAMGLRKASPWGAMQPGVPDDHVWKNYGPNAGADSIEYAADQLKGKTFHVDSAGSFAGAVSEIARRSGPNR